MKTTGSRTPYKHRCVQFHLINQFVFYYNILLMNISDKFLIGVDFPKFGEILLKPKT